MEKGPFDKERKEELKKELEALEKNKPVKQALHREKELLNQKKAAAKSAKYTKMEGDQKKYNTGDTLHHSVIAENERKIQESRKKGGLNPQQIHERDKQQIKRDIADIENRDPVTNAKDKLRNKGKI